MLGLWVGLLTGCGVEGAIEAADGKDRADEMLVELEALTADGELSVADVDALFSAAGGKVSRGEMLVIRDAVESTLFQVPPESVQRALDLALVANLFDWEKEHLQSSMKTYGGTETPQAVRDLLAKARLNGAAVYDVREVDEDDGEKVWSHYPAASPPNDNMTFEYTEIQVEKLLADQADTTVVYNVPTGSVHHAVQCPDGAASLDECAEVADCPDEEEDTDGCHEWGEATYSERQGGTGRVASHYDELSHSDIYARGSYGQKWANNCAFLTDGTLHCLPAIRRDNATKLILTNPALSRCVDEWRYAWEPGLDESQCKQLMYHGHIELTGNKVTSIELSGIPSKRVAKAKVNLVDPIQLLEAWGFEVATSIQWGNTSDGVPVRNVERGVIEASPSL